MPLPRLIPALVIPIHFAGSRTELALLAVQLRQLELHVRQQLAEVPGVLWNCVTSVVPTSRAVCTGVIAARRAFTLNHRLTNFLDFLAMACIE